VGRGRIGPIIAALVSTRPADIANVGAPIAHCPTTGPATGAALRITHETLLRVVLLIGGGMDELDAAVDAGKGSINVDHSVPPETR